jgi:uncharacterized protein YoxC
MTHDELMKALECCGNAGHCKECPTQGSVACVGSLLKTAKNTIERKAEALNKIKQEYASQFEANQKLLAENERLKADIGARDSAILWLTKEIDHQKAIASAELDSMHKLGDDYAKALEDEQKHIQDAKIEAVQEVAKKLIDKCYGGKVYVIDILVTVLDYMKGGDE